MFELNEDLEIVPVIIDFWKAKIDFEWEAKEYWQWEWPYHEAWLEWEGSWYVPDTRIISIISGYNIIEKDETELQKVTDEFIKKLEDLAGKKEVEIRG